MFEETCVVLDELKKKTTDTQSFYWSTFGNNIVSYQCWMCEHDPTSRIFSVSPTIGNFGMALDAAQIHYS